MTTHRGTKPPDTERVVLSKSHGSYRFAGYSRGQWLEVPGRNKIGVPQFWQDIEEPK